MAYNKTVDTHRKQKELNLNLGQNTKLLTTVYRTVFQNPLDKLLKESLVSSWKLKNAKAEPRHEPGKLIISKLKFLYACM